MRTDHAKGYLSACPGDKKIRSGDLKAERLAYGGKKWLGGEQQSQLYINIYIGYTLQLICDARVNSGYGTDNTDDADRERKRELNIIYLMGQWTFLN